MIHHINAYEYMQTVDDKAFDVIITDPPYDDFLNMDELRRVCKGHIIAFCDPRFRFFVPDEVMLWIKPQSSKNTKKHLAHTWEEILVEQHGNTYNYDGLESANFGGIYYDMLLEKRVHKSQKPLSLMERLVRIYSNPNDLIFDPFAGSGTTLKAAEIHGRRAVGCEVNK
jgi:DNA modification methylase